MKQPIFIGNIPIDEKRISFIEKVLTRLMRRASATMKAVVTPYPISTCVVGNDVRGEVLRYMFCVEGTINKAMVTLDRKPKLGIDITVNVRDEQKGFSKIFTLTKKSTSANLDLPVHPGDRMVVSASPIDPDDVVKEIWIAMSWIPSIRDSRVKSYLFDELENMDVLGCQD